MDQDRGVSVVVDSNKSVIVAGIFYSTVDFNAGPGTYNMTSNGELDFYLTEYDSSGNFIWAKSWGGSGFDYVYEMKKDAAGNLFLIGSIGNTVDFDPGPGVYNLTTTSSNTYVLKLSNNGDFIWVKQLPFRNDRFDIDASGNIILGGTFSGTQDFDPGPATYNLTATTFGSNDICVLKLDAAGNFMWGKQIRNYSFALHQEQALETDRNNNIYFAGYFEQTMDFDPGTAVFNMTSNGSNDGFLLKLDAQGNFVWVKQLGGTGADGINDIELDTAGNIYNTGAFRNTVDFDPGPALYPLTSVSPRGNCFIVKLDPNGNFSYAKNLAGESWGRALAIDASNDLYITGGFHNTVDFDPGPGTNSVPTGQLYTLKLNSSGNFQWVAAYYSAGFWESVYGAITVDALKNVYTAGTFAQTIDWDPGAPVYNTTSSGFFDAYIHKLSQCNNSLRVIDATSCTGYTLNNITYNNPGQYYQVLTNSVGCDSIIELNLTISTIVNNLTVSACGSYPWKGNQLTAPGIYRDTLRTINGCDSIVVLDLSVRQKPSPQLGADRAICFPDTIVLSPGNFSQYLWSNNSTSNTLTVTGIGTYWVNVTSNNGCVAADTIQIIMRSCSCYLNGLTRVYPNPFNSFLIIEKNQTDCVVRMNLYNAIGQLVMKDRIINDGINDLRLDKFASGMYFYKLHSEGMILLTGELIKK